MSNQDEREKALLIECPVCGAKPGKLCNVGIANEDNPFDWRTRESEESHEQRVTYWKVVAPEPVAAQPVGEPTKEIGHLRKLRECPRCGLGMPDSHVCRGTPPVAPKPAPQATPAATFEDWWAPKRYANPQVGLIAHEAWNAAQAYYEQKIDGIAYSRNKWHMVCADLGWDSYATPAATLIDAIRAGQKENAELKQKIADMERGK